MLVPVRKGATLDVSGRYSVMVLPPVTLPLVVSMQVARLCALAPRMDAGRMRLPARRNGRRFWCQQHDKTAAPWVAASSGKGAEACHADHNLHQQAKSVEPSQVPLSAERTEAQGGNALQAVDALDRVVGCDSATKTASPDCYWLRDAPYENTCMCQGVRL